MLWKMCLSTATKKDWNAISNTMLEKSADIVIYGKKKLFWNSIYAKGKEVCQNF